MGLFAKISSYDERSARLAGIGLMLLSIFMFSFGDALGKFMVATYSVGQLMWLRACAALLLLFPLIWRQRAEFKRIERRLGQEVLSIGVRSFVKFSCRNEVLRKQCAAPS